MVSIGMPSRSAIMASRSRTAPGFFGAKQANDVVELLAAGIAPEDFGDQRAGKVRHIGCSAIAIFPGDSVSVRAVGD